LVVVELMDLVHKVVVELQLPVVPLLVQAQKERR
jgi:hypothetical protein